jgi:phage-related protein
MGISRYITYPFISGVKYKQFDVINGISTGESRYYYATYDNENQNPSGIYKYNISSWEIMDEVATVFLTKTGFGPRFAPGSMIRISGEQFSPVNYTGMVLDGEENYVRFPVAAYLTGSAGTGVLTTMVSPGWTTEFFFTPSYSSSQDIESRTVESKFGDGYAQRQRDGINSNMGTWNLSFEGISDRQAKAIINFVEDKGGVDAFPVLFGQGMLQNDPNIKYIASNLKLNTTSYQLNSISVSLAQSFTL